MTAPDVARQWSLEGVEVPALAIELNDGLLPELAWRNELDGLTFRVREGYLKWNPRSTGVDLQREVAALGWLADRHPAPRVLAHGEDAAAQWMLTAPLAGDSAVSPRWTARPAQAVAAIAAGLRVIHALPIDNLSAALPGSSWATRQPVELGLRPAILHPAVLHGDACAPNTLIDDDGTWASHVDLGDLAVGDRWADLAVAAMSLEWNYGPGWDAPFYAAYGIDPDLDRIRYYRGLWDLES